MSAKASIERLETIKNFVDLRLPLDLKLLYEFLDSRTEERPNIQNTTFG